MLARRAHETGIWAHNCSFLIVVAVVLAGSRIRCGFQSEFICLWDVKHALANDELSTHTHNSCEVI